MENEDFEHHVKPTRRNHRSRRIDVLKEYHSGIVDERPLKERFSREFKKAKIKKIKNPIENIGEENCVEGLVYEVHRRTCEVKLLNGEMVTAMYRATTTKELKEFPAVGDKILLGQVNENEDSGEGVSSQKFCVVRVLPRKSELKRPGPRDSFRRELTLAANIDQVVIVASVTQPEFNYGFMDRYLLAANLNNLPFILVLTKTDLLKGELPEAIQDFASIVDKCILVSAKNKIGIEDLKRELNGKISVFSGQSGVGKSTLINVLVPDAQQLTGAVREKDGKGRHTTTSSSLLELPEKDFSAGGFVIDTPGIRSIGFTEVDSETLAKIFPGFFDSDLFDCKYSNCLHLKEPGCAVLNRIANGSITKARYESYLRILNARD